MEVVTIEMAREQARAEWMRYRKVTARRKEKYLRVMEDSLSQLRRGRKLIDIYEAVKNAGLNEKGEPKLGIACLTLDQVTFHPTNKGKGGSGWYGDTQWDPRAVSLPPSTFPRWPTKPGEEWRITTPALRATVPIVPAQFMPTGDLKPYYVLWEVTDWETIPRDPILLRRIAHSKNLFAVLATWDLTPLEQAVIRGR